MSRALILANGHPPGADFLKRAVARSALFVCADGGANIALLHGVTPHAIVGDLDSASPETLTSFGAVEVVHDVDTERTDTEKAIEWILARGPFEEISILGAMAGRLDHVVGHLSLLKRFLGRAPIVLEDEHSRAWLASGEVAIADPPGTVVSFYATGEPATGVTTSGLRYALRDAHLALGSQDSVSNVVDVAPASITIGRGELLVIVNR
jgi:thiamine pyrophosphokinase